MMSHFTSTAVDYPTSMGAPLAFTADADLALNFKPLRMVHTLVEATEPLGGGMIGKTSQWTLSENMPLSRLEPSPTHGLLVQLAKLRQVPKDERWPGAVWPDAKAFEDADLFIRCLPLASTPKPEISLADDGEINFLWATADAYVDLGFYGTRSFSYFARDREGRRFHGENVQASEGLPCEIVALLAAGSNVADFPSPSR